MPKGIVGKQGVNEEPDAYERGESARPGIKVVGSVKDDPGANKFRAEADWVPDDGPGGRLADAEG